MYGLGGIQNWEKLNNQLLKDNDYACFIWDFRDLILHSRPASMIRLKKYDRSELYRKKQQVRNWFLRTCKDRICQLAPSKQEPV